jgi:hypothetical protein
MPTPPTPIPSPGAARAAEAARLGRLVEAFPYRSHNRVTELALAVFGTIVFGAFAVLALGSAEGRFWAFIAGPLAVLSALAAVASFRRATGNRARQVCLYEGGFVVVDGARADAWSWPEVESVWQRIVDRRDQSGIRLSTDARWTVLRRDGARIVLSNDDIDGIDRLGDPIIRRTTEALLPQALADLQAGKTLPFGPWRLGLQGIGRERKLVPWPDVTRVLVANGQIQVLAAGRLRSAATAAVEHIPNHLLLLALAERLQPRQPRA